MKTTVGESDGCRGSGLNNPGTARRRAVPLRAVNARNNRAPRRNPRCDASLPTPWQFPLLTGKWACAANRRVWSRACRARTLAVPEPHDGSPKGALMVYLASTWQPRAEGGPKPARPVGRSPVPLPAARSTVLRPGAAVVSAGPRAPLTRDARAVARQRMRTMVKYRWKASGDLSIGGRWGCIGGR